MFLSSQQSSNKEKIKIKYKGFWSHTNIHSYFIVMYIIMYLCPDCRHYKLCPKTFIRLAVSQNKQYRQVEGMSYYGWRLGSDHRKVWFPGRTEQKHWDCCYQTSFKVSLNISLLVPGCLSRPFKNLKVCDVINWLNQFWTNSRPVFYLKILE